MDRAETIESIREAASRTLDVPIERIGDDVPLSRCYLCDEGLENAAPNKLLRQIERDLRLNSSEIWDGYPEFDLRAELRASTIARSLRLLAPFDRRAGKLLPEYAPRHEDSTIASIADSIAARRYVPSGLVHVDVIKPFDRSGSLWRIGGRFVFFLMALPVLSVIFPCDPTCQDCIKTLESYSAMLLFGLAVGLSILFLDIVPGLSAIRRSGPK